MANSDHPLDNTDNISTNDNSSLDICNLRSSQRLCSKVDINTHSLRNSTLAPTPSLSSVT